MRMQPSRTSKSLFTVILSLLVSAMAACSSGTPGRSSSTGAPLGGGLNQGNERQGGIDVGNMTAIVPGTDVAFNFGAQWKANSNGSLAIENQSGSKLIAKKIMLQSDSASYPDLERYLKTKYRKQRFERFDTNGLFGFRANLESKSSHRRSVIYLYSEQRDVIEVIASLSSKADGVSEGEKILRSARLLYKGVAIANAPVKQTTLLSRTKHDDYARATLALRDPQKGRGVLLLYGNSHRTNELKVGTAGYDSGRIIELGSTDKVPFDEVRIEGNELVSPSSRTPLSEIYSVFSTKQPYEKRDSVELKSNTVYLVRTISWPDEDLLTKIRVDELTSGDQVKITYQSLVEVPQTELQATVDRMNEHTLKFEAPRDSGVITLFNRYNWGDYVSATFNFTYGTRDNVYITRNSWDLLFEGRGGQEPISFNVSKTSMAVAGVFDVGNNRPLASIKLADFPDPNLVIEDPRPEVIEGHTYLVMHLNDEKFVYGAVRVLEIEPKHKRWVRLEWKRIAVNEPTHFQKWRPLTVSGEIKSVTFDASRGSNYTRFQMSDEKFAAESKVYGEAFGFSASQDGLADRFYFDRRPFVNDGLVGLVHIPEGLNLEDVSLATFDLYKGKLQDPRQEIKLDGVYLVNIENLHEKIQFAMQVVGHDRGKSISILYKRLFVGETATGRLTGQPLKSAFDKPSQSVKWKSLSNAEIDALKARIAK